MRKLISMAAVAAFLTVSVAPAHAVDAPAPATAAISPAKLALLARLDKAMNFEKMMKDVTDATMASVIEGMRQIFPEMTPDQSKVITEAAIKVNAKYIPQMKDITFQTYAEVLSEAELTAMVEFYESPEGHAILEKLPQINQRSMVQMSGVTLRMQKEMISTMCEKMTCPQALKDRVKQ